jgi:transcriptional regulator with XRE-family HTH domain
VAEPHGAGLDAARQSDARAARAPTLESVAALAGVSRATAGRVLAGSSTVGEQAREAVLRAAAELS